MVVDGSRAELLEALWTAIDSLAAEDRGAGSWRHPPDPGALVARTRAYITGLEPTCGPPSRRASRCSARWPPCRRPDENRPVSLNSRRRRNAARVYVEEEQGVHGTQGFDAVRRRAERPGSLASCAGVRGSPRRRPPPAPAGRRPAPTGLDRLSWRAGRRERPVRPARRPDRRVHLSQGPSARRRVPEHRDPAGERGGHPDPAARPRGVPRAVLPARRRFDRPVVIYSAGETRNIDATFLAWLLAGFGHPQVYVLDGGYFKWQLEQRPMVQPYPAGSGDRLPDRAIPPRVGHLDEVQARRPSGRRLLVDARPPDQYAGEAGAQMRRGHIPGAINHYWQDDLTQEGFGHVWKSRTQLRPAMRLRGSRRTRTSSPTATAPRRRATSTSRCATCWAIPGCGSTWARGPSGRRTWSCRCGRGRGHRGDGEEGNGGTVVPDAPSYFSLHLSVILRPLRLRPSLTASRSRSGAAPAARSGRPA